MLSAKRRKMLTLFPIVFWLRSLEFRQKPFDGSPCFVVFLDRNQVDGREDIPRAGERVAFIAAICTRLPFKFPARLAYQFRRLTVANFFSHPLSNLLNLCLKKPDPVGHFLGELCLTDGLLALEQM